MTTASQELVERVATILADYRHDRLEVTYGCKKKSVMAVDLMAAEHIVAALPQAADQWEGIVQAAYREGWSEGYATGDAGGSYTAVENDWFGSDAKAALPPPPAGEE